MNFKEYLNESQEVYDWQSEVKELITKACEKNFKNASIRFSVGTMRKNHLFATFQLFGDKPSQDGTRLMLSIYPDGDNFSVEYENSYIETKPKEDYMSFDIHKVQARKYKGDVKKISVNTDKHFKKFNDELVKLKNSDMLKIDKEKAEKYI